MTKCTEYVAVLRCQTWHTWPARTVMDPCAIDLPLGESESVPARLAVLSYENRSEPKVYAAEPTNLGPLAWDGTVPGLYVVRDNILKAPEDVIQVAIPLRHSNKGEVDICINFKYSGKLPPALLETIRATQYAVLSVLNLRLQDILTPAVPPHVREVRDSGASSDATVHIAVHTRRNLAKSEIEPVLVSVATALLRAGKSEKLRNALELYAAHFTERQVRVRFLLLIMAMEALTETTPKNEAATRLLAKWQADLRTAMELYPRDSEATASLEALSREVTFRSGDSISSRIRKLFQRVETSTEAEAYELGRQALRVYNLRSVLVHKGHVPGEDLAQIEIEARALLERLLVSYLDTAKSS